MNKINQPLLKRTEARPAPQNSSQSGMHAEGSASSPICRAHTFEFRADKIANAPAF